MANASFCVLNGIIRHATTTGVALVSDHPLCTIPHLLVRSSAIPIGQPDGTTKWLRPERSLARGGSLLLHHFAYGGTPWPLIAQHLKAAIKLAERIEIGFPDLVVRPLAWPQPHELLLEARPAARTPDLFNLLQRQPLPNGLAPLKLRATSIPGDYRFAVQLQLSVPSAGHSRGSTP